jgi:hypothetical protein
VKREPVRSELRRRHLFATVKQSVTVLVQWAHRMTEDTVDCKFCWRALSRLTIRRRGGPLGKRAIHLRVFTLTSLIVILLLSLGLWWVVWKLSSL